MKNSYIELRKQTLYCDRVSFLIPNSHIHNDLEMVYVKHGYVQCHADNKVYEACDGDIFLCFPNQFHYYTDVSEGEYYLFIISPDVFFDLKDVFENNIPKKNILFSDEILHLGEYMENILSQHGEYSRTVQAGLLNQLLPQLLEKTGLIPRITSSANTVHTILSYCTENYNDNISLDSIAKDLHISKYHISHIFNDYLGISFNNHINSLRVNKACELIKEKKYTMSYISQEVGFGSIRSFNRAFIQIMKTTPLKYKNSN